MFSKAFFSDDMDSNAEQFSDFIKESSEIEKVSPGLKIDWQIHVTFRPVIAPGDRPENPHIVSSVSLRYEQDFFSLFV